MKLNDTCQDPDTITREPGIYHDIPFDEYLKIDAFSNTFLWTLREKSPFHAKYEQEHPKKKDYYDFGRLLHMAILEPDRYRNNVVKIPDDAPKRPTERQINAKNPSEASVYAINWWSNYEESAEGKEIIQAEWYDTIEAMRNVVIKMKSYHLICGGQAEVTIIWDDPKTGLRMKGRLDYVQQGFSDIISDIKSDGISAAYDAFSRRIATLGYFQQAAIYSDGWKELTGNDSSFVWLVMEKEAPHCAKAWEADEDIITVGRSSYHRALSICKDCIEKDYWPSYGTQPDIINMPDWAMRKEGFGPYNMY